VSEHPLLLDRKLTILANCCIIFFIFLRLLLLLLHPPFFDMRDTSISLLLIFATKPFPSHLCYHPVQSWNPLLIRAMEQCFLERKNVAGLQKDKRLTEGGTKDRQMDRRTDGQTEHEEGMYIEDCGAPISQEISRSRSRAHKATHVIAFIQSSPHHLPS
jgi:hypothetical protein